TLTESSQGTEERHRKTQVEVAVEESGPGVGGPSARTAAAHEQTKPESRIDWSQFGQGYGHLQKRGRGGRVGCPPDVGEAKIQKENSKYPHREAVGFLLTGMKIYRRETRQYLTVPRYYGRSLDPEAVCNNVAHSPNRRIIYEVAKPWNDVNGANGLVYYAALMPFLQGDPQLAQVFVTRVEALRAIFVDPPVPPFAFYCSSLLLAYDESRSRVSVKLVDFAHWRPIMGDVVDPSGLLHGLNTLIEFLSLDSSTVAYSAPFAVI
uniref:Kinase n=1 Tax=Mesocestoides corti TaxID=53468 RepID=A0A5K3G180_MESCO